MLLKFGWGLILLGHFHVILFFVGICKFDLLIVRKILKSNNPRKYNQRNFTLLNYCIWIILSFNQFQLSTPFFFFKKGACTLFEKKKFEPGFNHAFWTFQPFQPLIAGLFLVCNYFSLFKVHFCPENSLTLIKTESTKSPIKKVWI